MDLETGSRQVRRPEVLLPERAREAALKYSCLVCFFEGCLRLL